MNLSTIDNLLHTGVAQSPITPPTGFTISGPEFQDRPSTGVDDDLSVRCITLTSYAEIAAIVSLDAWGISEILRNRITTAVSNTTGIPPNRVLITCTGNATSPPIWRDEKDMPCEYSNYIAYLPDIVAGTAREAAQDLEPAAVGTAKTIAPNLSCFAETPQDERLETERESLTLTAFHTADGRVKCILYNFACPATIIGDTRKWTSDYPGVASAALEQAGVECAIFLQGASADVRPFDWWEGNNDISHADRTLNDAQAFGILLATQAIRTAPNIVARRNAPVKIAKSADTGPLALRIDNTVAVQTLGPRPVEFTADLRAALPDVNLLVSTSNVAPPSGQRADTANLLIAAVDKITT